MKRNKLHLYIIARKVREAKTEDEAVEILNYWFENMKSTHVSLKKKIEALQSNSSDTTVKQAPRRKKWF